MTAQRRRWILPHDRHRALDLYEKLGLRIDLEIGRDVVDRIHDLAVDHALSAYDAAYLELALRRHAGLATADFKLATAAGRAGVLIW